MKNKTIDIEVYNRACTVIQAMHDKPWYRVGILHRKPWKGKTKPIIWEYLKDCSWYILPYAVSQHIWQWLTKTHDCSDPAIGCSCSGGFRFPMN